MSTLDYEPTLSGSDFGSDADRKRALKEMMRIREFEDRASEASLDGDLPGVVHLSNGQEAVAVGTMAALREDDYVVSTHRGHHHALAKGLTSKGMMAELYGRKAGYNEGKGGSMHIANEDGGFLGGNGIVGASAVLATGAALTSQYRDEGRVGVAFFGDGAVAQGQGYEAINLAATWDLPAIYVIENNQFGEATPVDEQHNVENLSEAAAAYGIPGVTIDGMDVAEVHETVAEARERAVAGDGPTIIEADTYRYRSHSEGRPQTYRTEEDIEAVRSTRDCIDNFRAELEADGVLADGEFAELRADVEAEMDDAVEFGRESPDPDPSEAYEDVNDEQAPEIEYFRQRLGE